LQLLHLSPVGCCRRLLLLWLLIITIVMTMTMTMTMMIMSGGGDAAWQCASPVMTASKRDNE